MTYRVILFLAAAFSAVLTAKEECMELGHPHALECCKLAPANNIQDLKDCMGKMKPPPNCDADICSAKKLGYAGSEDGKFDKKNLEAAINKDFASSPETAQAIIKNCINGDLSAFGPADFCDLTKFRHCTQMQLMLNCPEWETAGQCSEIKEMVAKCSNE